jgi:acetolactate synthase-1/2/3 large subunit
VAQALKAEGVGALFTLCGGHIAPIYDGCLDEGIQVVDTRHEQAAAHAADAWARLTRGIGVAAVTAGPGVTDAVTGVANALYAQSPMILLGGSAPLGLAHKGALQQMEQVDLFRSITKWATTVTSVTRIPDVMAMAFRIALSGRPGPVFVELPFDILSEYVDTSVAPFPTSYRTALRPAVPAATLVDIATRLRQAERPVVLAGGQVYWEHAEDALRGLAEAHDLPVYMNGAGRGTLPFDHPNALSHTRGEGLREADLVLNLGTALDFRLGYGGSINPTAQIIWIDNDQAEIGRNRGADVGVVADTRLTLQGLAEALRDKAPRYTAWLDHLRQSEARRRAKQAQLESLDTTPINHYRLAREIDQAIDEDTILVGDGGDFVATCAKVITVRKPGKWLDPGPLGCLGVGAPFAIAAKLLYPDSRVVILHGDGSFGLNGFDLETAVRWNLPMVSIVGNDQGWGQIRGPQVAFYGEARAVATSLAKTHYEKVVEAFGGYGEYVETPGGIRPAIERAFASGVPACVNVILDPKGLASVQAGKAYVL